MREPILYNDFRDAEVESPGIRIAMAQLYPRAIGKSVRFTRWVDTGRLGQLRLGEYWRVAGGERIDAAGQRFDTVIVER